MEQLYRDIWKKAEPYLATRQNDVHVEIAHDYARQLLSMEGGETEIVIPAIILHDVGWSSIPEEQQLSAFGPREVLQPGSVDVDLKRVHEVEGVKIASEILDFFNYPAQKKERILAIIDGHDTREEALSHEDKIVKDADKLFRFSPRGFRIDCDRFQLDVGEWHSRMYTLIEEWLFTASAQKIARNELDKIAMDLKHGGE